MRFDDILRLALRNLREARLRAALTTMGVTVGVAVIVTMVSFGLGLQRNTITRFKELDLFNEITVLGRSLTSLATGQEDQSPGRANNNAAAKDGKAPKQSRILDDAALAEIQSIHGVAFVEPTIRFSAYVRAHDRAQLHGIGGTTVPNSSGQFKNFAAGAMISRPEADEAVVDENFVRDYGYAGAAEAIGQTLELLAPAAVKNTEKGKSEEDEASLSFFGLPLDDDAAKDSSQPQDALSARSFRIVGVLASKDANGNKSGGGGMRGLVPSSGIYIPTAAARAWTLKYKSDLNEVALVLARVKGALNADETGGYSSATVRVSDPSLQSDVRKALDARGFNTFSILDQIEQIRTFFLIMNSVLGLLGGISLLVASLGIINTMLMSIFERTREIGIMKAIGAEDREIKLIFFAEAALIGLAGGIIGALAAWGIDALANRLVYQIVLKPKDTAFINFFDLPPLLWLGAILFAMLISILAALYPAARAARINPVEALRHN